MLYIFQIFPFCPVHRNKKTRQSYHINKKITNICLLINFKKQLPGYYLLKYRQRHHMFCVCLLELTWWIPRTACLIEVGCIGGSCGRIPSWIAYRTSQMREKKITNHSLTNRGQTHTHAPTRSMWTAAGRVQTVLINNGVIGADQ